MKKRIAIIAGFTALIFGSLITFPAHLHWMALCWVVIALLSFTKKRPMWPWLIGCVAIIAIKRPGYTIEFWGLPTLFVIVALVDWRSSRKEADSLEFG